MIIKHIFVHHLTSFYLKRYTCVDATPHIIRTCRNLVKAEIDDVIQKKFL